MAKKKKTPMTAAERAKDVKRIKARGHGPKDGEVQAMRRKSKRRDLEFVRRALSSLVRNGIWYNRVRKNMLQKIDDTHVIVYGPADDYRDGLLRELGVTVEKGIDREWVKVDERTWRCSF